MPTQQAPSPELGITCIHGRRLTVADARRASRKRPKVPRSGIPPINMAGPERDYFRELKDITDRTRSVIESGLLDGLEAQFPLPDAGAEQKASVVRQLARTFDTIESRIEDIDALATTKAVTAGNEAQLIHRNQQQRQLAAVGIDIFRDTPELIGIVEAFTRVNVKLIKSIPTQEL